MQTYLDVNGSTLYVESAGTGEPLILIHSGYVDSRLWDQQMPAFTKKYQVIRYDVRGFGRSTKPQVQFSHHEDLRAILDALQVECANLLGCSMGGAIAIDFALSYPQRVKSMILSGSSIAGFEPGRLDEASLKRSQRGLSIVKRDENWKESLTLLLQDEMWRQEDPSKAKQLREWFEQNDLEWLLHNWILQQQPPAIDQIQEITAPVQIILGDRDSLLIKDIAKVLSDRLPDSRTTLLKEAGHLPNLQLPQQFNTIVLDFLSSIL